MSFEAALQFVLRQEGGYVDNPDDPGGATNHGVTQHTYDAYRTAQGQPPNPVSDITDAEVSDIYATDYWSACHCSDIERQANEWLALVVFDTAVNSGVSRAAQLLQGLLGVTADGSIGPRTLGALAGRDARQLAEDYLWARLAFDASIAASRPAARQFLPGWVNRLVALRSRR